MSSLMDRLNQNHRKKRNSKFSTWTNLIIKLILFITLIFIIRNFTVESGNPQVKEKQIKEEQINE